MENIELPSPSIFAYTADCQGYPLLFADSIHLDISLFLIMTKMGASK